MSNCYLCFNDNKQIKKKKKKILLVTIMIHNGMLKFSDKCDFQEMIISHFLQV